MPKLDTLLDHFSNNASVLNDRVALRFKDRDGWHDISWAKYAKRVEDMALGLTGLGLAAGDMIGLLSTNRVEWLVGDLAALSIGLCTVPIYPNSIPEQVEYILSHCGARAVYVEDGEQLHKVQSVRDELPALEHVIVFDDDVGGGADGVTSWAELVTAGEKAPSKDVEAMRTIQRTLDPKLLATIVYTSGTTGPPKGAMLSHGNLVAMAESLAAALDLVDDASSLSFLPLSHIAERLQGEVMAIRMGYTVNIGEGIPQVGANLIEVEPTLLLCVPRLWEKMYAKINSSVESAPPLRRKLFAWATDVGARAAEVRARGQALPIPLRVQFDIADRLVLSKLRARLGLARAQAFLSGAAPLSAEIGGFFASLGITIQEAYGQTECTGVCTANTLPRVKYGTVGGPLPGVEVKIAQDGEILVKGPNVFMGYLNQPEATAETVVDGWLHTGDIGEFDSDGHLRITDRKKDIIVTAGGKNISPQNIENRIKTAPGISQVVVVGDKRKFLSCLVTMDMEAVAEIWAREEWGTAPSEVAVPADKRVRKLVQDAIDEVNRGLAPYETVKKFRVLERDFTVEDGELTPSLKVKRRVIQRSHEAVIDRFYDEKFV
jgi:long-chain acyl-CoA synthetase